MRFLRGRVQHATTVQDRVLILRPKSTLSTNTRTKVTRAIHKLGVILSRGRSRMFVTLRAVTKGNDRVKEAFRRVGTVCSKIGGGRQLEIYFSAYRMGSTKCSLIRSCSNIFGRFSRIVKLSRVTIFRVGSDLGPLKTRGSHRTGVKRKAVKFRALRHLIRSPHFVRVPGVLRAP